MTYILLAAGGTGGHVFPAIVLAEELQAQKHKVQIVCEKRAEQYCKDSKINYQINHVHAPQHGKWKFLYSVILATMRALKMFYIQSPKLVIGFGGYSTIPILLAAIIMRIPIVLHQQDCVLGKVNRLFARFAHHLSLAAETTKYMQPQWREKSWVIGPLCRNNFIDKNNVAKIDGIKILVVSGSQGARALATAIPKTIQLLSKKMQQSLHIVQQVRPECMEQTVSEYLETEVQNKYLTPFIDNIAEHMQQADLIISRAGAGIISEITMLGKPSILLPLPTAADNHQYHNAAVLSSKGAAILIEERDFSPLTFAPLLERLLQHPTALITMGKRAKKLATPQAAKNLATLITNMFLR